MTPLFTFFYRFPSLWPVALSLLFLPALVAVSRSRSLSALLDKLEPRLLWLWGLGAVGIFAFCDLAYLSCPAFFNFFESCAVSVAYRVFHGGVAFPHLSDAERYCLPYGPTHYLVLGFSQWLLGASTFSSKLPCCLAAALAIGLFWWILRRRGLPANAACALAGLTATIVLGVRIPIFWSLSDPLIFLLVTVGIWAAFRRRWLGYTLLGACIGLAMGLKLSAAAYFLPILVVAFCAGWSRSGFVVCGAVCLALLLLPFALLPEQFPWINYLAFFRTVAQEGFALRAAFHFLRWVAMLGA